MTYDAALGHEVDPDYCDHERDRYIAEMEAQGLVAVDPAEDELQLDIDSEAEWERHDKAWAVFCRNYGVVDRLIVLSRNGNRHVYVALPFEVDAWQRIAWQGALGSDPLRELLSGKRLQMGDSRPTLLIETEESAAAIAQWRGRRT